jgi:hypothetical protein
MKMKTAPPIVIVAIFILCAFVACEKEKLCSPAPAGPAVIAAPAPMNSPQCCSHRHFTSSGNWYYCCKCGILHAAGSGVGAEFTTSDVLTGAMVEYIAEDETIASVVYTDAEGHWSQEDIPDGYYTVRFTLSGYKPVIVENVELHDGVTNSDMDVEMELQ